VLVGAPALSPDGSKLAFLTGASTAAASDFKVVGARRNHRRGAPDGGSRAANLSLLVARWQIHRILFGREAKESSAGGGPVQVLCDAPEGRGASWSARGVIIFTPNIFEPLYKVPEGGGTPEKDHRAKPGWTHRNPYFLPDGDHFLFTSRDWSARQGPGAALFGASLSGEKPRQILELGSNVQYSEGYLLYLREPCWWRSASIPSRSSSAAILHPWPKNSITGTRATSPPSPPRTARSSSVMDRCRRLSPCGWTATARRSRFGEPGLYATPKPPSDGSLVGLARIDPDTNRGDIWVVDTSRNTISRSTFADTPVLPMRFLRTRRGLRSPPPRK
jgi:hypothetical protein